MSNILWCLGGNGGKEWIPIVVPTQSLIIAPGRIPQKLNPKTCILFEASDFAEPCLLQGFRTSAHLRFGVQGLRRLPTFTWNLISLAETDLWGGHGIRV